MSGISGPDVPDAPNMQKVTSQQATANTQAAAGSQAGSMINQNNQYGTINYDKTGTGPGGVPTYTATTKLSPQQQAIFDYFQSGQKSAGQQGSDLIASADYGAGAPDLTTGTNSRVTQRLKQNTDYLNPYMSNAKSELDTNLRNQGFDPNSEGYKRQMRTLTQNQDLSIGKITSDIQPEAFNQSLQEYQLPASMSNFLMTMGKPQDGVKTNAASGAAANYQPVNYISASAQDYNNQMEKYNAENAKYQAMISGIMGGAGALAGFPGIGQMATNGLNQFMDRGTGSWNPVA